MSIVKIQRDHVRLSFIKDHDVETLKVEKPWYFFSAIENNREESFVLHESAENSDGFFEDYVQPIHLRIQFEVLQFALEHFKDHFNQKNIDLSMNRHSELLLILSGLNRKWSIWASRFWCECVLDAVIVVFLTFNNKLKFWVQVNWV